MKLGQRGQSLGCSFNGNIAFGRNNHKPGAGLVASMPMVGVAMVGAIRALKHDTPTIHIQAGWRATLDVYGTYLHLICQGKSFRFYA